MGPANARSPTEGQPVRRSAGSRETEGTKQANDRGKTEKEQDAERYWLDGSWDAKRDASDGVWSSCPVSRHATGGVIVASPEEKEQDEVVENERGRKEDEGGVPRSLVHDSRERQRERERQWREGEGEVGKVRT